MVKITILYNLPEGADHDAFIAWRTGEHQEYNSSAPEVRKTDFYVARANPELLAIPASEPRYRYITELYFDSMDELEHMFFNEETQRQLQEDLKQIHEPLFLISEEYACSENPAKNR